jgi:hypothetical protein
MLIAQLIPNDLSSVMFAAGIALAAMILLRRWWRFSGRLKRESKRRPQRVSLVSKQQNLDKPNALPLSSAPADVRRAAVDLHELLREAEGRIDTKMRILQQMIAESRRESERLEQLLGESRGSKVKVS